MVMAVGVVSVLGITISAFGILALRVHFVVCLQTWIVFLFLWDSWSGEEMTAPIDFEERSAIREYDGNMSREEAEQATYLEIHEAMKQAHKESKEAQK